jgi:hypothetical protein
MHQLYSIKDNENSYQYVEFHIAGITSTNSGYVYLVTYTDCSIDDETSAHNP